MPDKKKPEDKRQRIKRLRKELCVLKDYDPLFRAHFLFVFNADGNKERQYLKDIGFGDDRGLPLGYGAYTDWIYVKNAFCVFCVFNRSQLNSETIAHEATHVAQFVLSRYYHWNTNNRGGIMLGENIEEIPALYVGMVVGKIVDHWRKNYKLLRRS